MSAFFLIDLDVVLLRCYKTFAIAYEPFFPSAGYAGLHGPAYPVFVTVEPSADRMDLRTGFVPCSVRAGSEMSEISTLFPGQLGPCGLMQIDSEPKGASYDSGLGIGKEQYECILPARNQRRDRPAEGGRIYANGQHRPNRDDCRRSRRRKAFRRIRHRHRDRHAQLSPFGRLQ